MESTEIEKQISKLCSQFQQMNKPAVYQIMTELEKLDSVFSNSDTPLHIQCRCITAAANLKCLKPDDSLGAEVQVNSLLQFMASSSYVARALACSLLRIFCVALNPLGQHISTQVTIICKNLVTTAEESLEMKDSGFDMCHAIACSSLCSITLHWANVMSASNSVSFMLLAVKFLLETLGKSKEKLQKFCYQVVVDGLVRLLKVPDLWTFILTEKEQEEVITRVLLCCQNEGQDIVVLTRLLQLFDNEAIMKTTLKSCDMTGQLLACLVDLLPAVFPSQELPHPLEVRWIAVRVIQQFVKLADPKVDAQTLLLVCDKGCCCSNQVAQLHQIVVRAFQFHLSQLSK